MKPFTNSSRFPYRRGNADPLRGKGSFTPRRIDRAKACLMLVTIALLSAMMSVHLRQDRVSLHLGSISDREVRAGRSVFFGNTEKTARMRQIAQQSVRPGYDVQENAPANASRTLDELFERLQSERASLLQHSPSRARAVTEAARALQPQFGSLLSEIQLRRLLTVTPAVFQKLHDTTSRLVSEEMDREIRDTSADLRRAQRDIVHAAQDALPAPADVAVVSAIAQQAIRPNRLYSQRKTESARVAAARAVAPIYERITLGDRIIGARETVTQETVDKLTALGLLDPRQALTTGLAVSILAAVMVLLAVVYIARTLPALYNDTRRLCLLALIVCCSVFGLKVGATLLGLPISTWQSGYLGMMSVAAAGMLVSVLLDMHLGMLIVALLSVQSGLIMNHEIRFTVMTLLGGLVGIGSVSSARNRNNLPATCAAIVVTNLCLVWLLGMIFNDTLTELLTGSAWAVGAALFATFVFWFGVQALEKPFGILTHTTLLEMSAFDRPLLQRLCAIAPGTYAHSMMVGTLAEAGAQAVGADALLCRVGGYYHDIGKMNRPDFFVENQRQENVHGRLSPSLSALIILAHVRDGVDMAKEHKLPAEIRDIIAQHHGTTLISYFYHQALADNEGGDCIPPGLEDKFRYQGPKPQTRESAIVMLADSVEAAARCLDKPDTEKLEALISNIVRGKIEDGQFDDCALTFRDVHSVTDSFLHVLGAMHHGRIAYTVEPKTATGQPMEVVRADLRPTAVTPVSPLMNARIATISKLSDFESGEAYLLTGIEPEVLYGRSDTEHAELPGANCPVETGAAPAIGTRRYPPRRHQRSADR